MRHLELFSGIGGFRRAIDLVCHDLGLASHCVGFSEIDRYAHQTYCANFNIDEDQDIGDIVAFTERRDNIALLPDFDLLTGGFPCQTFSMMGKQAGFEEERGQMFFRIMDIVRVKRPDYLVLENVKNLTTHNHGKTFQTISQELTAAGYCVRYDIFNTSNFGLPQTRNRTIIVARKTNFGTFEFSQDLVKESFQHLDKHNCSLCFYDTVIDLLSEQVSSCYYLSDKIKPTILSDGTSGFKSNSEIDMLIARPLTASMHKMHRACQDNYYSDLFIKSKGKQRPSEWMSKSELASIPIRKITPIEAFKLQGFPAEFATNGLLSGNKDCSLYKQAGNAVSVNVIYAVVRYLIENHIIID